MITMLRRLFWLGLLGGAGYAGWTLWQRQITATPAAAPEWPPMPSPTTAGPAAEPAATKPTDEAATDETATDASIASGTDQGVASISGIAADLPDAATPDDTAGTIDAVPTATAPEAASEAAGEAAGGQRWVDPLPDGGCPDGYPIKGNDNSGIYHVPGGRFYERTVAERCYATAEDAEADGYRAAKA